MHSPGGGGGVGWAGRGSRQPVLVEACRPEALLNASAGCPGCQRLPSTVECLGHP